MKLENMTLENTKNKLNFLWNLTNEIDNNIISQNSNNQLIISDINRLNKHLQITNTPLITISNWKSINDLSNIQETNSDIPSDNKIIYISIDFIIPDLNIDPSFYINSIFLYKLSTGESLKNEFERFKITQNKFIYNKDGNKIWFHGISFEAALVGSSGIENRLEELQVKSILSISNNSMKAIKTSLSVPFSTNTTVGG